MVDLLACAFALPPLLQLGAFGVKTSANGGRSDVSSKLACDDRCDMDTLTQ
jgi:hypothetical protein